MTGVSLQLYVAQVARYLMVAEREREESDDNDSSSIVVKMMKQDRIG